MDINTKGTITQKEGAALVSNGMASFNVEKGDVDLSNEENDFTQITLSADNISFKDSSGGVVLGEITANGSLEINSNDEISQIEGSKLSVSGETSLDAGDADIKLTSEENELNGIVNITGGEVILETVKAPKFGEVDTQRPVKGGKIQTDNINTLISTTVTKADLPLQNNIISNPVTNPVEQINYTTTYNVDNIEVLNNVAKSFNIKNDPIQVVSQTVNENEIIKVTLKELIELQNSDKDTKQKEVSNELVQAESINSIKVLLNKKSLVELIDGGLKLPDGVYQEFYIVKDEITQGNN